MTNKKMKISNLNMMNKKKIFLNKMKNKTDQKKQKWNKKMKKKKKPKSRTYNKITQLLEYVLQNPY